jgi:hypothetical protein
MNTSEFETTLKNWLTEWKTKFEEMQVKFTLGKMDAADAFEQQKEKLKELVVLLKSNLDKNTEIAEELSTKMRTKLDELWLQLNLGKADGLDAFNQQRKKIEAALHEIYVAGKSNYNHAFNYVMQLFDNNAQVFKTGLEIMQLQYKKLSDKLNSDIQKEIDERMKSMMDYAGKASQITIENIEAFNKQLRENYNKMQAWMNDLLKR